MRLSARSRRTSSFIGRRASRSESLTQAPLRYTPVTAPALLRSILPPSSCTQWSSEARSKLNKRLIVFNMAASRTTNPKILALLERILLGETLGALCAFAVNGVTHFHREGAKDAKKTPRRLVCGWAAP